MEWPLLASLSFFLSFFPSLLEKYDTRDWEIEIKCGLMTDKLMEKQLQVCGWMGLLWHYSSYSDPGSAGWLVDPQPIHVGRLAPHSLLHMGSRTDPFCKWQIQQKFSGSSEGAELWVSRGKLSAVLFSEVPFNGISGRAKWASLPAGLIIFVLG